MSDERFLSVFNSAKFDRLTIKYWKIVLLIWAPICTLGSQTQQDSLDLLQQYEKLDSIQNVDKESFLRENLNKSIELDQAYWACHFSIELALYHGVISGQLDSLYKYAHLAYQYAQSSNLGVTEARSMMFLGIAEFQLGDEEAGMDWYLKSAKKYEDLGADSLLASIYINIGHSIKEVDYDQYVDYLHKASQLSRKYNEPRQEAIAALGLIDVYLEQKDFEQATQFLNRAHELSNILDDTQLLSYCHRGFGIIAKEKGQVNRAISEYEQAIETASNERDKSIFLNQFAELMIHFKRYGQATEILHQSESIAKQIGANQLLTSIYKNLSISLKNQGQYEKSLATYDAYNTLKDSLHNEEIKMKVAQLTKKFESEQKEKENQTLLAENYAKDLELQKLNFKVKKRNAILVLIGFALFFSIIILLLNHRLNLKNKELLIQENRIKSQKLENAEKEKEVDLLVAKLEGEENERQRIARDLHDGLGANLAAIKLALTNKNGIKDAVLLLDNTSLELRKIAQNLNPHNLTKFGLFTAIEDLCKDLSSEEISIFFQVLKLDEEIIKHIEVPLYRMIQELVTNCVRHAHANEVIVQLSKSDQTLQIVVEDNGLGFQQLDIDSSEHLGLKHIKQRLQELNGQMEIHSSPNEGTSINLDIPLLFQNSTN